MSPDAATNGSRLGRWVARVRRSPGTSFELRVALLLAATAIAAGGTSPRRADLAGGAGGDWARAVRVEVKRSIATTSADQLVYRATVPHAAQHPQTDLA